MTTPGVTETAVDTLWVAAKDKLVAALLVDHPDTTFFEFELPSNTRTNRAITVPKQFPRLVNDDTAVKRIMGSLQVEFACMVRAGELTKGHEDARSLAYWLGDLFLADPHLPGNVARDVHWEDLIYQGDPPVELDGDVPASWASITILWEVDYARP